MDYIAIRGFAPEKIHTVCDVDPTLPAKLAFPLYVPVKVRVLRGRVDVVIVATPAFNDALPMKVVPVLNVTLPVGVPPGEVTVAVKVRQRGCTAREKHCVGAKQSRESSPRPR